MITIIGGTLSINSPLSLSGLPFGGSGGPTDYSTFTTWSQVGNGLSVTTNWPSITGLTDSRIAFIEDDNNQLRTYDFDGTNWSQVGNSLTITSFARGWITTLNSTTVALVSATLNTLRTYTFNGTDWSQVGNSLNIGTVTNPSICALSSTRVVIWEEASSSLKAYDWNGTDWSQVGNTYLLGSGTFANKIIPLSSTRVLTTEGNTGNWREYTFDGTNFTLGNSEYVTANIVAFCQLSGSYLAWTQQNFGRLFLSNYTTALNNLCSASIATPGQPTLTRLTDTKVAYIDSTGDSLKTYQLI